MILYLFIGLLVLCFVQDVRFRGIHWMIFPLILAGSVWLNFEALTLQTILSNMLFLIVIFGGLTLYLFVRNRKLVKLTQGYFSWGDILFLLAILPLFDTLSFIYFFTVGTLLSLIIHGATMLFKKQKNVPYAGYMAIASIAYLCFQAQLTSLLHTHVLYN